MRYTTITQRVLIIGCKILWMDFFYLVLFACRSTTTYETVRIKKKKRNNVQLLLVIGGNEARHKYLQ